MTRQQQRRARQQQPKQDQPSVPRLEKATGTRTTVIPTGEETEGATGALKPLAAPPVVRKNRRSE